MDTVSLIGRLLVSLAAVLGLMWVIARRMRRGTHGKPTQLIDVLGRQQLSRTASIAVVRVGEQALVVGITDQQVSVLADTDLGAAQALVAAGSAAGPRPARRHRAGTPEAAREQVRVPAREPVREPVRDEAPEPRRALAGSALSPQTWRQTVESLRDLTSRQA